MADTITYDEKVSGWTSFHTYEPEWMLGLNNDFFSFKNGQLFIHNVDNGVRNNFYGVQGTSKIETIINDVPNEDKIFKNVILEGDSAWRTVLETNLTNGVIEVLEFSQRESRYFSPTKRNEDSQSLNGVSQGVGNIDAVAGSLMTFNVSISNVNVDDELYQLNGSTQELVGVVSNITDNSITVSVVNTTPVVGRFAFAKKNARVEGGAIRGRFLKVELESDSTGKVELFEVGSNAVKSYV